MRVTTAKEMEAVLRLDGPARYAHFVKRVADAETAWGLWGNGGWALMADDSGAKVFPFWPAREYAEAARVPGWEDYESEPILLDDLLNELLPQLAKDSLRPAVFPTPGGRGTLPTVEELIASLREELRKYGE